MFKTWLPLEGIFSIPLIIKVMVIFTIKYFYFSNPVPFNEDHLFAEVT
ncbi:MAG: hypothetical protein ACJAT7_003199 [Psychromonas sp.]|jgi:hypothetical protein